MLGRYRKKPENGGTSPRKRENLEMETRLAYNPGSISCDKSGRCCAVRPPIPAEHVWGVHPQTIHLKPGPVRLQRRTDEINKKHKPRRIRKNVFAPQLSHGRRGAYCRRKCAQSFWPTANRRSARNGLA